MQVFQNSNLLLATQAIIILLKWQTYFIRFQETIWQLAKAQKS